MRRVIGLSGPPGSGKSALAVALAAHTRGIHIDYDDYQQLTRQPADEIAGILADHDYNRLQIPHLVSALASLKTGSGIRHPVSGQVQQQAGLIYFETPLGRAHHASGVLIDHLIWLDIPLDIALARNLLCCAERFAGEDSRDASAYVRWLDSYLRNYNTHVGSMLNMQRKLIRADADLIVDATQPLAVLVKRIVQEIEIP